MDVSPTTAVSHALVGNMVVHGKELLLQFILRSNIRYIVIGYGNTFHQFEILVHFHTQLGKHILIPIRYHTFVSFRLTHHEDRQTAHFPVFVRNLIVVILFTDSRHFLI